MYDIKLDISVSSTIMLNILLNMSVFVPSATLISTVMNLTMSYISTDTTGNLYDIYYNDEHIAGSMYA